MKIKCPINWFFFHNFFRDLRVVTNEEFSTVDPLRTLPIDDKESFVRFYGEEGTVLIDSDVYDLKFGVRDQALTCKVTFAVDMKRGPTEHDVIVHVPVGNYLFSLMLVVQLELDYYFIL